MRARTRLIALGAVIVVATVAVLVARSDEDPSVEQIAASPDDTSGPDDPGQSALPSRADVLVRVPSAVKSGNPLDVDATIVCARLDEKGDSRGCAVTAASVRTFTASGNEQVIDAVPSEGRFSVQFSVTEPPGTRLNLRVHATVEGTEIIYPPGDTALEVLVVGEPSIEELSPVPARPGRELTLPYGTGEAAPARTQMPDAAPVAPSSFDIGSDGSVAVLDTVNNRILEYGEDGAFRRSVAIPLEPSSRDLALVDSGYALLKEGSRGEVSLVSSSGELVSHEDVPYGVAYGLAHSDSGRVVVRVALDEVIDTAIATSRAPTVSDEAIVEDDLLIFPRHSVAYRVPDYHISRPFFVTPTEDGRLVVASTLWRDREAHTLVIVADGQGKVQSALLLPEKSVEQGIFASAVRFDATSNAVVVNESDSESFRLRWYAL